jgi:hypothetical protein
MKQLKVALSDDLRARLDAATARSGRSLADEIRRRVELSLEIDAEGGPTAALAQAVLDLAALVYIDTGQNWYSHAAAHWAFRTALTAWLQRRRPAGERKFAPGDLPSTRLVASDDPEAIGLALEAINFQQPAMTPEQQRKLDEMREKDLQEMAGGPSSPEQEREP